MKCLLIQCKGKPLLRFPAVAHPVPLSSILWTNFTGLVIFSTHLWAQLWLNKSKRELAFAWKKYLCMQCQRSPPFIFAVATHPVLLFTILLANSEVSANFSAHFQDSLCLNQNIQDPYYLLEPEIGHFPIFSWYLAASVMRCRCNWMGMVQGCRCGKCGVESDVRQVMFPRFAKKMKR